MRKIALGILCFSFAVTIFSEEIPNLSSSQDSVLRPTANSTLKLKGLEIGVSSILDLQKKFNKKELLSLSSKIPENKIYALSEETFIGYDSNLYFFFYKNTLYRTRASLKLKTTVNSKYIEAYEDLFAQLSKKYGTPTAKYHKESSNQFMDDALAIKTGDAYHFAEWKFANRRIYLELSGDNYEFNLFVTYSDSRVEEIVEKIKEQQKQDEL